MECLLHCWSEGLCPVCGTSFAPEVQCAQKEQMFVENIDANKLSKTPE